MHLPFALLAIAATVIAVSVLADRIRFSAPLLLMLVGIGTSFVVGDVPTLTPEIVLLGFLPPLLYAAAIRTSVIDFRANRVSIGYLSVLLVAATALVVGLVTWLLLPVSFGVAFALGAVVAPPDAVAATSIARRVGLPRRLVTILEGESLVNDATAITCLRVGLATLVGTVTVFDISIGFVVAAAGGIAVGFGVATLVVFVRKHLQQPVIDTAISFVIPFAAYLPAELIHYQEFRGSGVISVVTAGLILGHKSPLIQSGRSRLSERVNWATIQFLLENTVFLVIGLQARSIVNGVASSDLSAGLVAGFCVAVLVTVIGFRLLWVLVGRFALLPVNRARGETPAPLSHSVVLGWAGLRGVVTLATAYLIPIEVDHREVLILAAMVVTAGTLLIQGLTLPYLVHWLRLRGPDSRSDALQAATVLQSASAAGLVELDRVRTESDDDGVVERVRERIASRPDALWERLGTRNDETPAEEYRRLRLATIGAERAEVLRIRSTGTVAHDVLEQVLGGLDIEESMLTIATEQFDELDSPGHVETPAAAEGPCDELAAAPHNTSPVSERCEDCVREGTRTVHLRLCLTCGNVGCCDSSPARHASRHADVAHHPVIRSFEPGESWRWCFLHERIG